MGPSERQIELSELPGELTTGLDELDVQHRYFLTLTKALQNASKDRELSARLMLDVARYAQCHFAYEETLMLAYEYPDRSQHVKDHQLIIEALRAAMTSGMNVSQARLQLIEWMTSHIPLDDIPMAQFVLERRPSVVMRMRPTMKSR